MCHWKELEASRGDKAREELQRRQSAKEKRPREFGDAAAFEVDNYNKSDSESEPDDCKKKVRQQRIRTFENATSTHPYADRLEYTTVVTGDYQLHDSDGNLLFSFYKNALPKKIVDMAAAVLSKNPKAADLRSFINGGVPPLSGIAGYYDYSGSPIALKCRKTAFTYDHFLDWQNSFPLIEHLNELYKKTFPKEWNLQDQAIPNPVRIRGSVFSTVTVNQKFRTAVHTDAGDFDAGYGVLAVLDGSWEGCMLGFPETKVCII